ncbi:Holliday junction resolvase RuvX [Thermosediminibacter oceani]|uniref:Putative pre-16S rRNA nuclease n=1 Tax=Thermosediminibacter oceani (strain ATCC BAA-1034 / DSM 16646 / JW/IW-1228P) TaxID=555079 RepID=D9RXN3_THEOJ|nr:Holliday junction resolvase RuvX [Thermosediminibacter oceani]ADL08107.1 Holliday junction resolvase YqgF [Thermosediminibacter oceani DSM 16646]
MRILGLDVGNKRIGVAVSDELGITAQGVGVIERGDVKRDIERISEIVKRYQVKKVIIGLPLNMNGTLGPQGQLVKDFGEKLRHSLNLDVEYWDERLSTVTAEKVLIDADISRRKRKGVIDKLSAIVILQSFLDSRSNIDTGSKLL